MQDVASSWDQYERVTAPLMDPTPAGLILHVAGPTDEGFRTIEIWESETAWRQLGRGWIDSVLDDLQMPPQVRELHVRDLVQPREARCATD